MKSKEKSRALTKEGPTREVKKDHEGRKAQKEGKKKKKKKEKTKRTQTQATSGISTTQEADPLRESLGDLEKDMDGLEDPEKDVGDTEDRTSHSQVSLKKGKIRQMSCRNQEAERSEKDEWYPQVQYLTQESRDLG